MKKKYSLGVAVAFFFTAFSIVSGLQAQDRFSMLLRGGGNDDDEEEKEVDRRPVDGLRANGFEVVWVDNQSAPGGTGSKTDPVDTIQDGVDVAFFVGANVVVVRGGGQAYVENVTVFNPQGLEIYGDGQDISCDGDNPYSGNGVQPVLEGGILVEDLPIFTLMGLTVVDGFAGQSGVEIVDVEKVKVIGNRVFGTGGAALFAAGIYLRAEGNLVADFEVSCNQVDDNEVLGIALIATGNAEVRASFSDNELNRNMSTALRMSLNDSSRGELFASDNTIVGNGTFGFGITAATFDTAEGNFEIVRNNLEFVGISGFAISATGDSKGDFLVGKNVVRFSGSAGAALQAQQQAEATINFSHNTITEGDDGGVNVQTSTDGILKLTLNGNQVSNNADFGFNFVESLAGDIKVSGNINNNSLAGNFGNEVEFSGDPGGSFILNGAPVILPTTIP